MTRYFYIIICFLLSLSGYSQLSAEFSANKTTGCGSLGNVTFTDLSTGNPTNWTWDFGNGNTSALQSPTANYPTDGNFTVTLTVGDGTNSQTTTKTAYIQVFRNPTAILLLHQTLVVHH